MDVHVRRAVTVALRLNGVDVLTAQEDGAGLFSDPELLDRAGVLGRVLFSQDDDLLREATRRQREGIFFSGVIYAHQLNIAVGPCIDDLTLLALAEETKAMENSVVYLPLS